MTPAGFWLRFTQLRKENYCKQGYFAAPTERYKAVAKAPAYNFFSYCYLIHSLRSEVAQCTKFPGVIRGTLRHWLRQSLRPFLRSRVFADLRDSWKVLFVWFPRNKETRLNVTVEGRNKKRDITVYVQRTAKVSWVLEGKLLKHIAQKEAGTCEASRILQTWATLFGGVPTFKWLGDISMVSPVSSAGCHTGKVFRGIS